MDIIVSNTYTGAAQIIPFPYADQTLGRAKHCDIVLDSPFVSRHHARLVYRNKKLLLQAVGMNGTSINGVLLKESETVPFDAEDRIEIGEFVISLAADTQS